MAEEDSISLDELDIVGEDSMSFTDDVVTYPEILPVFHTRDRDEDDWIIIQGTEAIEEDGTHELYAETNDERQCLIPRTGPRVRDYLAELFTYLRNRTEFNRDYFCAPIELQTTMEQMETARIPVPMWRAFINVSVNLLSRIGIQFDRVTFLDVLIWVLTIVSELFIHNVILQIVVLILGCMGAKLLNTIITSIYEVIKRAVTLFLAYIKEKLRDYCEMSAKLFKIYMKPKNH